MIILRRTPTSCKISFHLDAYPNQLVCLVTFKNKDNSTSHNKFSLKLRIASETVKQIEFLYQISNFSLNQNGQLSIKSSSNITQIKPQVFQDYLTQLHCSSLKITDCWCNWAFKISAKFSVHSRILDQIQELHLHYHFRWINSVHS